MAPVFGTDNAPNPCSIFAILAPDFPLGKFLGKKPEKPGFPGDFLPKTLRNDPVLSHPSTRIS